MKKYVLVLVLLFVAAALFGQSINLGSFPVGRWLDHNYNVIWDFSSSNIRILSTSGAVLYDFSDKTIQNFRVSMDGIQPVISFSCPEAGRSYRYKANLPGSDVTMEIERPGLPNYSVQMRRQ